MPSIQIPTVKTLHIRFHMVPIWFSYGSICVVYTHMPSIHIPTVKTLHIWFHTVPVQFLYGSICVVYTYMPGIQIPTVKTLHIQFHTVFVQYLTLLYYRFLHCSPLWGQEICNIFDEHIGKHYHEQHEMEHTSSNDDKLISHLPSLPSLSMKDQFTALFSISNFHWCDNPSLKSNDTFQTKTTRISTHLVYPDEDRRLHLPTSPRNRLIYMLTREEYDMHIT